MLLPPRALSSPSFASSPVACLAPRGFSAVMALRATLAQTQAISRGRPLGAGGRSPWAGPALGVRPCQDPVVAANLGRLLELRARRGVLPPIASPSITFKH